MPWNEGVRTPICGAAAPSPPGKGFWPIAGDRGTLAARWRSLEGKRWIWYGGAWSRVGDVMVPIDTMAGLEGGGEACERA
jgi:hypothetical protein